MGSHSRQAFHFHWPANGRHLASRADCAKARSRGIKFAAEGASAIIFPVHGPAERTGGSGSDERASAAVRPPPYSVFWLSNISIISGYLFYTCFCKTTQHTNLTSQQLCP